MNMSPAKKQRKSPNPGAFGLSVSTVLDTVTPQSLEVLRTYSRGPLEIHPRLFPDQHVVEMFNCWREQNNIEVASLHVPFGDGYDVSDVDEAGRQQAVKNVVSAIELACRLNAGIIVLHGSFEPIEPVQRTVRVGQLRQSMDDLAEVFEKNSCRLAIEYLPRSCIGNSIDECMAIVNGMSTDLFGICLDVNHLMEHYATLPEVVRQLNGRLFSLHISDYDGVDEKHWLPGEGLIDWEKFIASLRSINYSGPWIYECKLDDGSLEDKLMKINKNQQWLAAQVPSKW